MAVILEVSVNGEPFAVAGEESLSVLSTHVTAAGKLGTESAGVKRRLDGAVDIDLSVGGLTSRGNRRRDEHLRWGPRRSLKAGDEVRIVVREGDDYTPATGRHAARDTPYNSAGLRRKFIDARSLYFRLRRRYGTREEKKATKWQNWVRRSLW